MERKNFNKEVRMDAVCSELTFTNEFLFIYFIDEYAYVMNYICLIRNKISEISNFTDEEIKLLDGKCLYANSYKKVLTYNKVDITEDGFKCYDKYGYVLFSFSEPSKKMVAKQFDPIISSTIQSKSKSINTAGFNFDYIGKIKVALYHGEKCVIDCKENCSLLIKSIDEDASGIAVLMGIALPN